MALLLVTLAAFAAGAMNAVAGGGTFIAFPALTGIAGLTDRVANMTSTIGLWPGSASSILPATREFSRLPRGMLWSYSAISLVGGACGAVLLRVTSDNAFKLLIPWLLAFATVVFACSKPIARWAGRGHGVRSTGWTVFVGFVQFAVAVYGGYFGAGIGVLMLAGLAFAGLDDIHQMNALKVLLATVINGVACGIFLFGHPDWRYVTPMAISSTIAGFVGMAVARRVKQDSLRVVILVCGVALTIAYFVKNYGPLLRARG